MAWYWWLAIVLGALALLITLFFLFVGIQVERGKRAGRAIGQKMADDLMKKKKTKKKFTYMGNAYSKKPK